MMSTVSFKEKIKQISSFFVWELKSSSNIIIIYSILTGVLLITTLTLCLIPGNILAVDKTSLQINTAGTMFQFFGGHLIYIITVVFTVIYTIKMYMYLHNKRQIDLYGSMPVSRATLFFSKSISALIFSLVPALIFMAILTLITFLLGAPLYDEIALLYVKMIIGSLACISAYGLVAICCGTTSMSVIMFLVVCISYPLVAHLCKGIVFGFFVGLYADNLNESFVMNAFNPLNAYSGNNIIYWLIFTAVCLVISAKLIKKRRVEKAQSSFVFYLPCNILKMLVSLLAGLVLGIVFGTFNVFNNSYLGFVFGFVIASVSAFVVSHLIIYKGFTKILKTSVLLVSMIAVVSGAMALCCFNVFGYNNYIPELKQIESAGFIDGNQAYLKDNSKVYDVIKDAGSDFDDETDIEQIRNIQTKMLGKYVLSNQKNFLLVWYYAFLGNNILEAQSYKGFSYHLKDGSTYTRYYNDGEMYNFLRDDPEDAFKLDFELINATQRIVATKTYQLKYSALMNASDEFMSQINIRGVDSNGVDYHTYLHKPSYTTGESRTSRIESGITEEILEAYRKDFEADTTSTETALYIVRECWKATDDFFIGKYYSPVMDSVQHEYSDAVCYIELDYGTNFAISDEINSFFDYKGIINNLRYRINNGKYVVPKSYTNTIEALKKAEILNDDLTMNSKNATMVKYDYYDGTSSGDYCD